MEEPVTIKELARKLKWKLDCVSFVHFYYFKSSFEIIFSKPMCLKRSSDDIGVVTDYWLGLKVTPSTDLL